MAFLALERALIGLLLLGFAAVGHPYRPYRGSSGACDGLLGWVDRLGAVARSRRARMAHDGRTRGQEAAAAPPPPDGGGTATPGADLKRCPFSRFGCPCRRSYGWTAPCDRASLRRRCVRSVRPHRALQGTAAAAAAGEGSFRPLTPGRGSLRPGVPRGVVRAGAAASGWGRRPCGGCGGPSPRLRTTTNVVGSGLLPVGGSRNRKQVGWRPRRRRWLVPAALGDAGWLEGRQQACARGGGAHAAAAAGRPHGSTRRGGMCFMESLTLESGDAPFSTGPA